MDENVEIGKKNIVVSDNIYERLNILKAKFSAKKEKSLSWNEAFRLLLEDENKVNQQSSWIYTIEIFIVITFILMFPAYISNPLAMITLMPIFLAIGFGVAYFSAYILTPWSLRAIKPYENAPANVLKSLEDLSKQAGIKCPKLMILETPENNAMVYMSTTGSRLCVTAGLMDAYKSGKIQDGELNAVLCHEIGHIKNQDCLKRALALSYVSIFDAIGDLSIYIGRLLARMSKHTDGLWKLFMALFGLMFVLSGYFQKLIAKAASTLAFRLSRKQEHLADEVGAELVSPGKMAGALEKMDALDYELVTKELELLPYADTWQLQPQNPSPIDKLFDTHPSTEERSSALRKLEQYL